MSKKAIAMLLCAAMAGLSVLSGCSESVPANWDTTQGTSETGTNTTPVQEHLSETEREEVIAYVKQLTGGNETFLENIPVFNDIKDIHINAALRLALPLDEYVIVQDPDWIELAGVSGQDVEVWGYPIEKIEQHLKEHLHPDFSIGSYNLEHAQPVSMFYYYDAENQLIVTNMDWVYGGGIWTIFDITDTYKAGGEYYVDVAKYYGDSYAFAYEDNQTNWVYGLEHLTYTIGKNANGNFNVSSVQSRQVEPPVWLKTVDKVLQICREYYLETSRAQFEQIAFLDIGDTGTKDVILVNDEDLSHLPPGHEWIPEHYNAIYYVDSDRVEYGAADNLDLSGGEFRRFGGYELIHYFLYGVYRY